MAEENNQAGNIQQVDIDSQMRDAYLDYAMSVIVARALPDARDGLKPVHRRILFAMQELGLRSNSAYKKSARIVGEVLGKFHPHGDSAVYETMARMAQDFSMRYLLVDGQGNFGSVDGDAPAAMRYTEARLHRLAEELLADIDKDTVDFGPNFDDSLEEPLVLPARVPNMLLNGTAGIAVGMATNIPPHNLGELTDAIIFLIDNYERMDDISLGELMKYVQGPDFPTGGIIVGREGIESTYGTGKGRIVVRTWAQPQVRITGTLGKGAEKLEVDGDGRDLSIEVKYPERRNGWGWNRNDMEPTILEITVPQKVSLDIESVSAEVDVQQIAGRKLDAA